MGSGPRSPGTASSSLPWTLYSSCHVAILNDIRTALRSGQYRVSLHAAEEMLADELSESQVLIATDSGEVIEDYPSAFPFPACLMLGHTPESVPIHAVWAFEAGACYAVLITVYKPEPARWTVDLRTRVKR